MFRGRGRGGGEYTVLEVKGYPGDVVQYIGDVPPGLNRNCLGGEKQSYCSQQKLTQLRDVAHHNTVGFCLSTSEYSVESPFNAVTIVKPQFDWRYYTYWAELR